MNEEETMAQYQHDTTELYTIYEAQQILAKRECAAHGHDFSHVVKADGSPSVVVCDRCHTTWMVAK